MFLFVIYLIFNSLLVIYLLRPFHQNTNKIVKKKSSIKNGEQLLREMTNIKKSLNVINTLNNQNLPEYKFYTDLIYLLSSLCKLKGIKIQSNISNLYDLLKIDLRFSKKIYQEKSSAYGQFISISFLTWAFILITKNIMPIKLDPSSFLLILFFQLIGGISFYYSEKIINHKMFYLYQCAIYEFIVFYSLYEVGESLNKALKEANIENGLWQSEKKFDDIKIHFSNLIEDLKKNGVTIKEELILLIYGLYESLENDFEKFNKLLSFSKFLHLVLFYLTGYFIYLHGIFKFFIEQ